MQLISGDAGQCALISLQVKQAWVLRDFREVDAASYAAEITIISNPSSRHAQECGSRLTRRTILDRQQAMSYPHPRPCNWPLRIYNPQRTNTGIFKIGFIIPLPERVKALEGTQVIGWERLDKWLEIHALSPEQVDELVTKARQGETEEESKRKSASFRMCTDTA